nr:MAG TPA: hypothetical protein [Caudoviricetes sp.]
MFHSITRCKHHTNAEDDIFWCRTVTSIVYLFPVLTHLRVWAIESSIDSDLHFTVHIFRRGVIVLGDFFEYHLKVSVHWYVSPLELIVILMGLLYHISFVDGWEVLSNAKKFYKKRGKERSAPSRHLSSNARIAFTMRFWSAFGSLAIESDSSEETLSLAWSITSNRSASAETPSTFAIATKVSSLGAFTPRSITLMWFRLISSAAAKSSWVMPLASLAALILAPIACKSIVTPPSGMNCSSEIIISAPQFSIQQPTGVRVIPMECK